MSAGLLRWVFTGALIGLFACTPEGGPTTGASRTTTQGPAAADALLLTTLADDPGALWARAAGRGFDARFAREGVTLHTPLSDELPERPVLALVRFGCPGSLTTVERVVPRLGAPDGAAAGQGRSRRAEYVYPGIREWYENRSEGLEQGFTLDRPPCGEPRGLQIHVGYVGAEPTQRGEIAELCNSQRSACYRYSGLHAQDATGRTLPSQLRVEGMSIRLSVDDHGAQYPVTVDPLVWLFMQKLRAMDAANDARLGTSLAMTSDLVATGAPGATTAGFTNAGAVYVFSIGSSSFALQGKLVAADPEISQGFGSSLAISGDTIAVGTVNSTVAGKAGAGAVYVFVRSGGLWMQQAKLVASDAAANASFGAAVALDKDTLLVGSPAWTNMGRPYVGAGYLFTRSGGVWTEHSKLTVTTAADYDQLGARVALDGKTAALTAIGVDVGGTVNVGAVYVFGESGGTWSQQAKIDAPASAISTRSGFGYALSLANDTLAIGSDYSRAYVFARMGMAWMQQADISLLSYQLGRALSLQGTSLLIGSPGGGFGGEAYLYGRMGMMWSQTAQLRAFDAVRDDQYGGAVAQNNSWVLVANPAADVGTVQNGGAIYAYKQGMPLGNGASCSSDTECSSGNCVDGVCCDTTCGSGLKTDCQACSVAAGAAMDGKCGVVSTGFTCRPAASDCDVAEVCDGVLLTCGSDKIQVKGVTCRMATGPCDQPATCSGTDKVCPPNPFKSSLTVCRPATGACDAAETCSGFSATCPEDKLQPILTVCRSAAGPCDTAELCSGFSRDCPADKLATAGTTCRMAAGPCDVAESCSGTAADCPADAFAPSTTVCRASARDCDAAEQCSGSGADCPADKAAADGATCSTGVCGRGACMPQADLRVTLGADKQIVRSLQAVRFTAMLSNQGRGDAMVAALTLAYPPQAALSQLGGPGFGCMSAPGGAVCTVDKLAAGGSATLTLELLAPQMTTVFNVSAQAKSALPDPIPENNFATLLVKIDDSIVGPGPGPDPDPTDPMPKKPQPEGKGCSYSAQVASRAAPQTGLFVHALVLALAGLGMRGRRRRAASGSSDAKAENNAA